MLLHTSSAVKYSVAFYELSPILSDVKPELRTATGRILRNEMTAPYNRVSFECSRSIGDLALPRVEFSIELLKRT